MRRFVFTVVLSLIAALPLLAQPVGMAAHVAGPVVLERDGKKSPLKLLQRVEAGDVVRCEANAQAVIVLFNGGARFQIGAGDKATVQAANVVGARKLAALAGPSANVVKLLGGARVGAVMARRVPAFERLTPQFPGWLPATNPRFEWLPLPGAVVYTFTLFDPYDNVVWSTRSIQSSADYPADAPVLLEKRTYLWRLSGFAASGKPVRDTRCGLVTFLSAADSSELTTLANALQEEAKAATDSTPLLMLAEAYRSYGVLGRTLEVLEDERLRGENGIADAKNDVIASLSPFARAIADK